MAVLKLPEHKKQKLWSLFFRFLLISSVIWISFLGVTLIITLHVSLSSMQKKIEKDLIATAVTLSNSLFIRQAFENGRCPPDCIRYLDSLIRNTEDLDIITVANRNSIRLYHVRHDCIGKKFVGGDESRVLQTGEIYITDNSGTMGMQHRVFAPVRTTDGAVAGFVMASTTLDSLRGLYNRITVNYAILAGIMFIISLIIAGTLSLLIRHMLLGLTPEALIHGYLVQSEILNNMNEGIISVDSCGQIQLVNMAAEKMLCQRQDLIVGRKIDSLLLAEDRTSLLYKKQINASTSNSNVLCTVLPAKNEKKRIGTTLILTDKSEAFRLAEQLNGTRHIISQLRASRHEFMNKLHVISGMLQMNRQLDALSYINGIAADQSRAIGPLLEHIHNASLAALILGKLSNMREQDITFTLLPNSELPEHSTYLSSAELVVIIGNLLENSIEAINLRTNDGPRNIVLQITEDVHGLLITISDTGMGIPPDVMPHIYENGFSTKAATGRGMGMWLIRTIIDRHHGTFEADSEAGIGFSFTIYVFEKQNNAVPLNLQQNS
jgi:two-component system, CitB family, sensor histidine kinase DctS